MKKLFLTLMALICTMSINAQMVKIMKGDQLVFKYKVPNGGKVVFEKAPDLGIKGKATRTDGIEVNWVQLWEGGPRFAEYNVGAANNKAEDFGGYYYFGMAIDKDMNATYYNGNSALTGNDDTATNLWGDNWRMPTEEELESLVNNENCACTWTMQNGVNGLLCTGKEGTAFASNGLFLPAAGEYEKEAPVAQGSYGIYWSSMPNYRDNAYVLVFNSDEHLVGGYKRYRLCSIRAVLNETK